MLSQLDPYSINTVGYMKRLLPLSNNTFVDMDQKALHYIKYKA